jgi:hypothetical protein
MQSCVSPFFVLSACPLQCIMTCGFVSLTRLELWYCTCRQNVLQSSYA